MWPKEGLNTEDTEEGAKGTDIFGRNVLIKTKFERTVI